MSNLAGLTHALALESQFAPAAQSILEAGALFLHGSARQACTAPTPQHAQAQTSLLVTGRSDRATNDSRVKQELAGGILGLIQRLVPAIVKAA